MISPAERRQAADALTNARLRRAPIAPLTETFPGFDVEDAYAVQELAIAHRRIAGARPVGWKVGLTSLAMQRQLGVDQPDFGPLLDEMRVADGACPVGDLISPRVEGELAFVLGDDVGGSGVSDEQALAAVERVVPALEIIDSRVADWRIALADTIADHASSARFALGGPGSAPDGVDLAAVQLVLEQDGVEVDRGVGAAVLGHPVRAVAWLARTLDAYGERLHTGDVVLAGALHAAIPVVAGSEVRARFDGGVGEVAVRFEHEPHRQEAP